MKPSLEKLYKFLRLESDRGYDNRAVLGGLDRILDSWEVEARADHLPEDLIQAVQERLHDYPRLSESSRMEVIEGLWKRIQQATGLEIEIDSNEKKIRKRPSSAVSSQKTNREIGTSTIPTGEIQKKQHATLTKEVSGKRDDVEAALETPVTVLSGVGPRHAQILNNKLGLYTLRDLLYYFPRRYDDYSQMKSINRLSIGDEVTILATVQGIEKRRIREGKSNLIEILVSDGTGALRLYWFNQAWIADRLRNGAQYTFSGKIEQYLGRLVMNNPEAEPVDQQHLNTGRIVPVYRLTERITQHWLRKQMNQVVTYWAPRVVESLPEEIRHSAKLPNLPTALLQVHFPDSWEQLKAARHRLAFDEIFLLQIGVLRQKQTWHERPAKVFESTDDWLQKQKKQLPYQLTSAQHNAINDIQEDLVSGHPMNRLLQGDVGSGKTIIAALAIALITHHGSQAALMAPTSILASQHYNNLRALLCRTSQTQPVNRIENDRWIERNGLTTNQVRPILQEHEIRLLIGSTPEAEKQEIREGLKNRQINLVVGTHALIEEPVEFADLQLTIVDEQHRFGVQQRAALRSKGTNPHLLVMTATPIPRSLALTIYGDLDLTVMDEMPPGRQEVSTYILTPGERERAYQYIRVHVEKGFQAFIICPLVSESETSEAKAAIDEYDYLQTHIFPTFKLGLMHGRLKPDEKDEVMSKFQSGEYHILVSTPVVEVGVDIPNATVMLIEGANHFGLAQLHQFRGRVGRGSEKAVCILIPDRADSVENERLQVMTSTNDGFALAEHDLKQRGPGEFLGTRQAGYSEFKLANLIDARLIETARKQAQLLFEKDPGLSNPQHQGILEQLNRSWYSGKGDIS